MKQKKAQNLLKSKIFLFFSEALSMCNQFTKCNGVTSKEDRQKNKFNKQCSKLPSMSLIQSQCLYCKLWTMFVHVICLKFQNIRKKNRKIKVISIKNEEIIVATTMTKTIITKIIITIMMRIRIKIGNRIQVKKR